MERDSELGTWIPVGLVLLLVAGGAMFGFFQLRAARQAREMEARQAELRAREAIAGAKVAEAQALLAAAEAAFYRSDSDWLAVFGDLDQSRELCDIALTNLEGHAGALRLLGRTQLLLDRYPDAEETLLQAGGSLDLLRARIWFALATGGELRPELAEPDPTTVAGTLDGIIAEAYAFLIAGDDAGISSLVRAAEAGHGASAGFEELSLILAAGGIDPIENLTRAIDARPGWPLALTLRGHARLAAGDPAGARTDFEQAIEVRSAFAPAWIQLARLDAEAGDVEGALRSAEQALLCAREYYTQYRQAAPEAPRLPIESPLEQEAELMIQQLSQP